MSTFSENIEIAKLYVEQKWKRDFNILMELPLLLLHPHSPNEQQLFLDVFTPLTASEVKWSHHQPAFYRCQAVNEWK